ncbi:MAG: glycosyltransferase family 4 protein, partial [Thermodesulfobacteriota bacterium]|nr:glycosyltransferase family 4 protein [Thermodesulfobacteriota bacterium]
MKICIAIEKFDPAVGGAERYCWDLAHFFAQRGHRVDVICMRSASDENIKVNEENSQLKTPGAPGPVYVHLLHPMPFPQGLRHLSFALLHYLKAKKMQGYCHFCVGNTFFMDIYQPHGGLHRAWFLRETMRYPASIRPFTRFIKRLTLKDMVQRGMEWWIFRVTRPEVI